MKRALLVITALLALTVCASAQYFTGFSVISYKIASAWPTSFRSVRGNVDATIGNTGDTRSIRSIHATIYRNGRPFAAGTCEDVTIPVGTGTYRLKGRVELWEGVSTWEAIGAAFSFRPSEYTVDFTLVIVHHPSGTTDNVFRQGIPLTNYLHR